MSRVVLELLPLETFAPAAADTTKPVAVVVVVAAAVADGETQTDRHRNQTSLSTDCRSCWLALLASPRRASLAAIVTALL